MDDERKSLADEFESSFSSGNLKYFDTHEFIEIIDFFLDQNETQKAEKAINNALIQHPNSTSISIRKADWLFETNNFEEAEKEIDYILEIDTNNSEANELKGDILIHQENPVEGILHLQKALVYTDEKLELLSKIGVELIQIDQLNKALQFFLKILDEDVYDEAALYNSTYCYELLNQPDKAIQFLNKYIDKNPYSQIAWHQLGIQYKALEKYENAIWAFDYATLVDDAFLGAFFEKATCLEATDRHHEAIDIYKMSLKIADPTAWAYYRLGDAYAKIGDSENALTNYFKAIHEDPMYGKAWHKIAVTYNNNSQPEQALEFAEKAVEIEFDNKDFNSLLARLFLKLSNYEAAENIYENLISLEVEDSEIWIEYAILLKTLGYEDDAIELLLKSLAYFPKNAEILYRLTGCLFKKDKDLEAIDLLREALKLDFNKKDILKLNYPIIFNSEIVQDMIFAHKFQRKFL